MKKILFSVLWMGASMVNAQNNHITIIQYQDGQYDFLDATSICPSNVKTIASSVGLPNTIDNIVKGEFKCVDQGGTYPTGFTKSNILQSIYQPNTISNKTGWDEWHYPQIKSFWAPWIFTDYYTKHRIKYVSRSNEIKDESGLMVKKVWLFYSRVNQIQY